MKPRDEPNRLCPRRRPQSSVQVRTTYQTLSVLGGSYPNILLMEGALPLSVFITRTLCLCSDLGVPNLDSTYLRT